jgi:hypothetical protein
MRRRALWTGLIAVALGVLVFLLVLIGVGYLRLPGPAPGTGTITEIEFTINQGTAPNGQGWFGPTPVVETTGQVPLTYTTGSPFTISWSGFNRDSVPHNITGVTAQPPFSDLVASPSPPCSVPGGFDGGGFSFQIVSSATGNNILYITINAIGPNSTACF